MDDFHVVTVATESKLYFPYLQQSCAKNGKELEVLGMGEKWQGFNWRFKKMTEYLESMPKTHIVCFVDGYDVLCVRDLHEIKSVFLTIKEKTGCKMVVALDNIYENKNPIKIGINTIASFFFGKCNHTQLNAGTYLGYAGDTLEMIQKIYSLNPTNDADDQLLMTSYCSMNPNDIYIDTQFEMFLVILDTLDEVSTYVTIVNNEVYYNNQKPFFVHAANHGYLDNLIQRLGYDDNIQVKSELYSDFYQNKLPNHIAHFSKWIIYENMSWFVIWIGVVSFFVYLFLRNRTVGKASRKAFRKK